jgi:hypothetical protein
MLQKQFELNWINTNVHLKKRRVDIFGINFDRNKIESCDFHHWKAAYLAHRFMQNCWDLFHKSVEIHGHLGRVDCCPINIERILNFKEWTRIATWRATKGRNFYLNPFKSYESNTDDIWLFFLSNLLCAKYFQIIINPFELMGTTDGTRHILTKKLNWKTLSFPFFRAGV